MIGDEQQKLRDFIDALRSCIGLRPLYREVHSHLEWLPVASDGNRRTSSVHGNEQTFARVKRRREHYVR